MTVEEKIANEISQEKGVSNWLTALPIEEKVSICVIESFGMLSMSGMDGQ